MKFTIQYHCNTPYFLKTLKFHRKTPGRVVPWSIIYFKIDSFAIYHQIYKTLTKI